MEREFKRNSNSYRPHKNDSRDDYQRGNNESQQRTFGERKERREYNGNRYDNGRSYERNSGERRERNDDRERKVYRERTTRYAGSRENRPFVNTRPEENEGQRSTRKVLIRRGQGDDSGKRPRTFRQATTGERGERKEGYRDRSVNRAEYHRKPISGATREELKQKHYSKKKILAHRLKNEDENSELRLNRYISMGGVCSRRDADELIVAGRVKVNGEVVETVGQKVRRKDRVEVDGVMIFPEKKVYLVLNKPKDYVTTVEDPLERKTVMSLVEDACKERIYPVGRLDRQTTGVLLFTNDGDLAKKLTHPKYEHKKIYHVFLDKPLSEEDLQAIAIGVDLEDGFIKADEINYTSPDRTEVGIEIHSGKNRIVRRIFEHFGYQIVKLDRVYFAGITKKNVPRGKWRFLTSREVNMLKVY